MNVPATSGFAPVIEHHDVTHPSANKAEAPKESVKGVFVQRTIPVSHICCTPGNPHHQENGRPVTCYEISSHPASTTMTNPLQAPGVQQTPGLPSFLEWLKENHTETLYNCLAHRLANNTTCFTEAIDQLPDPENQQSVFEAVTLLLFQGR
ncbi:hypothetical protein [Endozoicomonas sp. GU-1]|uniref:hypothetical protein n=1 Tax=Endozoicomonas sp. GU-1 TaxID=3009078 RepID=UPI0022B2D6D5|nr:hypothetical protein [Endozoicomonas sp. GU-1]WBA83355.1 hypothetical protein O2T12_09645 [Endozoicomonas sp. GU-1]WBA86286.1 hypothetical protein O3276_24310 [Endozoicomonas sp. GU-1]